MPGSRQPGVEPGTGGPVIIEDTVRLPPQAAATPLLERPISRTEYLLGPGDLLTLAVFGFRSEVLNLSVTPEGSLVIPGVGIARVGGLNLEQAERVVATQVRRFNRDAEVNLSLAGVRSFKVFLVGDVPAPGMREATAVTRVSELLPRRNAEGVIHRNVWITRTNGEVLQVDLARFLQLGDLSHNPVLHEGDVVHTQAIDRSITVTGQAVFPGIYDYRYPETLAELIRIANGGGTFRADAADTLRLLRFAGSTHGEILSFTRADAEGDFGRQLLLEPFDALYIPRIHFGRPATATIEGEVNNPGIYPIQPDVTTVRDLIEMAGGITQRASLVEAVLRREPIRVPGERLQPLDNIPPEFLSREELRIRQVTSLADERNVVIDFERLYEGDADAAHLRLQDGDLIFVPEQRLEVAVIGAVGQPGIVPFRSGQPIEYFVDLAGGYNRRADRRDVVVLKAGSGGRIYRDDVTFLEPGDRIVVPFKEPVTFAQRMESVQGVASLVSGLIVTFIGAQRLFEAIVN